MRNLLETYQLEREPHANWTIQQAKLIGEMMEQYSYREKGEKYVPSSKGYGEVFPHLTEDIMVIHLMDLSQLHFVDLI